MYFSYEEKRNIIPRHLGNYIRKYLSLRNLFSCHWHPCSKFPTPIPMLP